MEIISNNPDIYNIYIPVEMPGLAFILGIEDEDRSLYLPVPNQHYQRYVGKYPIDIHSMLTAFYIYCNIIDDQIVGNSMVSLLKAVHTGNDDDMLHISFTNQPTYKRVRVSTLNNIELLIGDTSGRPVIFGIGTTIVELRLRRII